jgi:predicted nucleotidyltransferase
MKKLKSYKIFEADDIDKPIENPQLSFYKKKPTAPLIKKHLHPIFWEGMTFNEEIRERLLAIAKDFYASLELETPIIDIILVGSIANYNWHKLSDLDVHILIDFSAIDDNEELVSNYLEGLRKEWNAAHNITIKSYEVEISIQDSNVVFHSAGVFSLLNNKWEHEPTHITVPTETIENTRKIANNLARQIDELDTDYETGEADPVETYKRAKVIWKKVKNLRAEGLATPESEFSVDNLAFKKLRTDNYLGKIVELKNKAYDAIFTIEDNPEYED